MKKTILRILFNVFVCCLTLTAFSAELTLRLSVSIAAALFSLTFLIISRVQIGKAFAVTPQAKGLVTSGVYSRIQHPMYLFISLLLASIISALNIPLLLILWAILVTVQFFRSRTEEKVLENAFGEQFRLYIAGTWI